MALYDLVSLKQALTQSLDVAHEVETLHALSDRIANIRLQVPVIDEESQTFINTLSQYYTDLSTQIEQSTTKTKSLINKLDKQITEVAHKLFADSYELEERTGGIDHVRNGRRIILREDVEQDIKNRILLHTNWRYPAMEIGCRDGEWTQYLVAADPLYIVDQFQEFLSSTNNKFSETYQRRLRKYQMKNHDLSALPENQFAFVFSWGHFNYVSLDTITQVLKQVKKLLRPGGIFLFSYNDGDTTGGAGMAENFAQTYIPKSILVPTCASLGFEILSEFHYAPNITWIEIKLPGILHTVKAHQVMGEIKRR
jgi:SAM-dependent methyltransferase